MAVYQNDQCGIIKMARHFLPINEKYYLCINMLLTCLKPTFYTSNPESVFSYLAEPWRALFYGRSSRFSLAGSILVPMKVQEGPLSLGRVPQ